MPTIEYSVMQNDYLLVANILFFFTFLLKNQLMFRLVLISAITFLIFFNLSFSTLFLDVIISNLLMVFINLYNVIKLFINIIPPELDNESLHIYQSIFKSDLTKRQFKKFIHIGKRRVFRVNSPIALSGNGFSSIFLIVNIPNDAEIKLRLKESYIANLEEQSWIGIVEYVEQLNKGKIEDIGKSGVTGQWAVDSVVLFNSQNKLKVSITKDSFFDNSNFNFNEEEMQLFNDDIDNDISSCDYDYVGNREEVIVYEWTLKDLGALYSDTEEGNNIKTSLHSLWLVYLSKFLKRKLNDVGKRRNSETPKATFKNNLTQINEMNLDS